MFAVVAQDESVVGGGHLPMAATLPLLLSCPTGQCPGEPAGVLGRPQLGAAVLGLLVELAAGAGIGLLGFVQRGEEVVGPVRRDGLVGLLGLVAGVGQVTVEQCRDGPVGLDGGDGAAADPELAGFGVLGREDYGPTPARED